MPVPPSPAVWELGTREYATGLVVRFEFNVNGRVVPVAVTTSWLRAWRKLPLSLTQRIAVRTACVQVTHDRVHPCLGKRQLPLEPVGAWMASPCPGVTITWRLHWSEPGVPVMLTLTYDPSLLT